MDQEVYNQIAEAIILQQEQIIGPIAIDQAELVNGLTIDWSKHNVDIAGNGAQAIDSLVEQYRELFGEIAVQACKDSASRYLSELQPEQIPKLLS